MADLYGQMDVHSATLLELMEADERIVVMTADLVGSCRLTEIERRYPDRFINVGVAEQNMVSISGGLALAGFRPVTHTFSIFSSLRACEQVRTDVFYNELPVLIVGSHSGVSTGPAGPTHYSIEDMAVVRAMPGSVLCCPSDDVSAEWALRTLLDLGRPAYLRLDRNPLPRIHADASNLELGRPVRVAGPGSGDEEVVIFACGAMTSVSLEALHELEARGIRTSLYDVVTLKPLDDEAILRAIKGRSLVVTVEEHTVIGGLGGAVAETLRAAGPGPPLVRVGIPDLFPQGGPPESVRARLGLTRAGVVERISQAIEQPLTAVQSQQEE